MDTTSAIKQRLASAVTTYLSRESAFPEKIGPSTRTSKGIAKRLVKLDGKTQKDQPDDT